MATDSQQYAEMNGLHVDKEVAASKDGSGDLLIKEKVLLNT